MKEVKVKGCEDCLFRYTDYDDFAVDSDTLEKCILAENLEYKEYIIDIYDTKQNQESKLNTPSWCPLIKDSIIFKKIL